MAGYEIKSLPIAKIYVVVQTWFEDGPFGLVEKTRNAMTFQYKDQAERWIRERA